jgi:uncharacterized membrane protein (DUF4010 family)
MVLALGEKERLSRLVMRIAGSELRAGMQFAVLALVVLPLLPSGSYGPLGGIQPRNLWIVVLVFTGLNFAGYLARRAVGPERGYGVTGLLGGLISSTAVTLQFSRLSRDDPSNATGLAVGVVGASTVLIPRVLVLSTILNAEVVVLVVTAFRRHWGDARDDAEAAEVESPLRLASAIRLAIAFQVALMAIRFASENLGQYGVLASAAVLGLTDTDALTLSMNRLGEDPGQVTLAARAIAVGVIANGVLKLGLTLGLGGPGYRRLAGAGQVAMLGAAAAGLWLYW